MGTNASQFEIARVLLSVCTPHDRLAGQQMHPYLTLPSPPFAGPHRHRSSHHADGCCFEICVQQGFHLHLRRYENVVPKCGIGWI
jgi:hypothetical protein